MPGILDLATGGIPSLIQTGAGIVQGIIGASKAKKYQNELENLQTPTYSANKGILDYYNTALQRYGINPYQSQQYQAGIQQGQRSLAAGLGALQDRRSAIAGVGRLSAIANQNALNQGIAAEQQQNQRFGQLGQATQMKTADDLRRFQYNEIAPYEKKYNLLAMKAGQANQMANAGFSNIFGGLSSGSMIGSDYAMNNQNYNRKNNYSYGGGNGYYNNGNYIGE